MDRISKFLAPKKKKLALENKRREEEQLRLEVQTHGSLFHASLLQDAMRTPRSPREVVVSPRPLPEDIMKDATPRKEKRKRASLNGEFIVGKELGKGSSGTVSMAINKTSGEIVAVKTVPKRILTVEAEVRLRREYALMKVLRHHNLIKLLDVLENPQEIIIIMEYASHGDLFEYIVTQPENRLSEEQAKPLFAQIALGVQYLHAQGFIHRDLKPENVLLGEDGRAYIADLGFGTSWHPKKVSKTQCGSLMYASPEIVGSKAYVGPEVDVWSLGVLLYAMTTGRHPFHGNDDVVRKGILSGNFKMHPYFSDELCDLLKGAMTVDRKERYSIDKIVNHPWLAGVAEEWKAKAEAGMETTTLSESDCSSGGESSGSEGEEKESRRRSKQKRKNSTTNSSSSSSPVSRFSFSWPKEMNEEVNTSQPSSPVPGGDAKRKKKSL